jgi:hypothetical protein
MNVLRAIYATALQICSSNPLMTAVQTAVYAVGGIMSPAVLSLLATTASVFLKGFQHKNVIKNKYVLIGVTSYLMAVFDVIIITLIANNGLALIFWNGTGAAIGMLLAVALHERLFK